MTPTHFRAPADFRRWLEKNHASAQELWVAFYKKGSGQRGMGYREALDEALCFGWIDGIVKRVDAERYMQRFTPRRTRSIWSNVNVGPVERLIAEGKIHAAGLAAYAARDPRRTGVYSFERQTPASLSPEFARRFRANKQAWAFFQAQPPGYRRLAIHRVMMAKQAATRERWLDRLIIASSAERRLDAITGKTKSPKP